MNYSIRIDSPIGFIGYLSVKNRISWKTKSVALKHLEDYKNGNVCQKGYIVTLESF